MKSKNLDATNNFILKITEKHHSRCGLRLTP